MEQGYDNAAYEHIDINEKEEKKSPSPQKSQKITISKYLIGVFFVALSICLAVATAALVVSLSANKTTSNEHMPALQQSLQQPETTSDAINASFIRNEHATNLEKKLNGIRRRLNMSKEEREINRKELEEISDEFVSLHQKYADLERTNEMLTDRVNITVQQIEQLTNDLEKLNATAERQRQCPRPYTLNPYSDTCIRLVRSLKTWQQAKSYCENVREHLITFGTLDSAAWFVNLRKTESGWNGFDVWIGGKKISGRWQWAGRLTAGLQFGLWAAGQPSGGEDCMESDVIYTNSYKFNDAGCNLQNFFVCEKNWSRQLALPQH